MERVCESCARQDDDLVLVQRVTGDGGTAGADAERTELWCFDCRTEQEHRLVEDQA